MNRLIHALGICTGFELRSPIPFPMTIIIIIRCICEEKFKKWNPLEFGQMEKQVPFCDDKALSLNYVDSKDILVYIFYSLIPKSLP